MQIGTMHLNISFKMGISIKTQKKLMIFRSEDFFIKKSEEGKSVTKK